MLSRRQAQQRCQEEYLDTLVPGDIISARVTHLEPFGCFVDIGCGIASLLPIDAISVSRIAHPSDRFRVGEEIRVVVRSRDEKNRITLSHRELLGTWEEKPPPSVPGTQCRGLCGRWRTMASSSSSPPTWRAWRSPVRGYIRGSGPQ